MKVRIDPAVYILAAFFLLAIPLDWLCAWIIAAALHEAGHILAVRLLGGRIGVFRLGLRGALIDAEDMGTYKNVTASLAGPVVGAMPILLARWFPRMAVCAAVFSFCNLLPVFPLDGGRILRQLCEKRPGIAEGIEWAATVVLLLISALSRSFLPVIMLLPLLREKYLAKRRKKGYNSATIEMR